ncbi:ABC transporter permease subunit [Paenarthrobacter sp. MSM-2-10-13]|nr:ABC transporter permease subunit [Paenarthrobacter sp. MSM-2-10-13]
MNIWTVTLRQEITAISRERLPRGVLAVFLGMTAASAFIGSSAKTTVSDVYREVAAQGLTTAHNPFDGLPALYYARNNVIYIIVIGALLAIITGVQSTTRDRRARTADLVLSRNISPATYLGAKLTGLAALFALLLAAAAILTFTGIAIVTGAPPTWDESLRLAGLYALAWLFLMPFLVLGMLSGLHTSSTTTALLAPIVLWSIVIFILPLAGTAALPVSLLNPVPAPAATPMGFFAVTSGFTGPLSVGEQFKHAAAIILQDQAVSGSVAAQVLILGAVLAVVCVVLLATNRQRIRSELHA